MEIVGLAASGLSAQFFRRPTVATPRDCQCFALSSSVGTLPKAFQTNTTCLFGFFNAPQLAKASFRRCVAIKKPPICMGGFVERTGIEPVLPG